MSRDLPWLGEPSCADVALAGGKGASLSRMIAAGLPVPRGFVVGADIFAQVVGTGPSRREIEERLDAVDVTDAADLARASGQIRELVRGLAIPNELIAALRGAIERLDGPVAVRSSAVAEDSGSASYAGQQETYLEVVGPAEVIRRIRDCWASFFSEHAIFYRKQKGSLWDVAIAVVVQRMIAPDKAGVMFTIDPVQRRRDRLVIEAVRGLGEVLVSGEVTPDNYQVARADGRVLRAFVPPKRVGPSSSSVEDRQSQRILDDDEIAGLVALGLRLEEFFGGPQDVEWGIVAGKIYLLQSRPVTT